MHIIMIIIQKILCIFDNDKKINNFIIDQFSNEKNPPHLQEIKKIVAVVNM